LNVYALTREELIVFEGSKDAIRKIDLSELKSVSFSLINLFRLESLWMNKQFGSLILLTKLLVSFKLKL